jgi:hypothetical protein
MYICTRVYHNVTISLKKFFITNPLILEEQNSFKIILKSAKARVTGTIPYCHGKIPHSRKLLSLWKQLVSTTPLKLLNRIS